MQWSPNTNTCYSIMKYCNNKKETFATTISICYDVMLNNNYHEQMTKQTTRLSKQTTQLSQ